MRQADAGHLSTEELLRALDDELTDAQGSMLEAHLAACEECSTRLHELGVLSVRLESWAASVPVEENDRGRALLSDTLAGRERIAVTQTKALQALRTGRTSGGPGLWHWAASAGVAAAVVMAAMLSPGLRSIHPESNSGAGEISQTFEIAGETFVALPYSNGDLPLSAPHIVQMEVPATSLAEAGIVFEPVSSEQANPDRAVLADVLLGADGEPLGVHVLTGE
jgi:hypothetical protein